MSGSVGVTCRLVSCECLASVWYRTACACAFHSPSPGAASAASSSPSPHPAAPHLERPPPSPEEPLERPLERPARVCRAAGAAAGTSSARLSSRWSGRSYRCHDDSEAHGHADGGAESIPRQVVQQVQLLGVARPRIQGWEVARPNALQGKAFSGCQETTRANQPEFRVRQDASGRIHARGSAAAALGQVDDNVKLLVRVRANTAPPLTNRFHSRA